MAGKKPPAIGIDLGTTYSCVGVLQHGKIEIIHNEQGNRITPSCVAFTEVERLIGDPAKSQIAMNSENTIFDAKRLIGRDYDDPKIQDDLKNWPFKVVNYDGKPKICTEFKGKKKVFTPEEISAMVLKYMKEIAEKYLGETVTDAVITVPAYFNNSQREATVNAGKIAGLNVLRIINEPTAAALAYGLEKNLKGKKNVLIFDLGGGTLDVSVLTISEGSVFEVRSVAGDTHLGGEDFDSRLVDLVVGEVKSIHGKDLRTIPTAIRRLRTACELAKRELSSCSEARIEVDSLCEGNDFSCTISRARFDELCIDLFRSTIEHVEKALNDAKLSKSDIDVVVLVGGSTRIPKIQKLLKKFFNDKQLCLSMQPDEAVAYGAAVQAALLNGSEDEKIKDIVLHDVTPLSLGIEAAGGVMSIVIERNTRLPCRSSITCTTHSEFQSTVLIQVYQGERKMTKDNHRLGKFMLSGIPPARRGVPNIEITFELDESGLLKVSASDRDSGNSEDIHISHESWRLSKNEVERMIEEAKRYKKEDAEQKEKVAARNALLSYVCSLKETAELAPESKLSVSEKEEIREYCESVLHWMEQKGSLAKKKKIDKKMANLMFEMSPYMKKLELNSSADDY